MARKKGRRPLALAAWALCLLFSACGGEPAAVGLDKAPAAGPVTRLESHRGATALWRDGDLWVSTIQDWDRPSPVRLSRGTGPIQRTVRGWMAGVRGGRAYVLVPDGDQVAVESMDATGPVTRLGTVAPAPEYYRYHLAVASAGEVVVAGGDVDRAGDVVLIGPTGTRRLSALVERGDGIRGVAADPRSPRIALVLQQLRGTPLIERGAARLLMIDTAAGAVLSTRDLGPSLSAIEGEVAFDTSGALWINRGDRLERTGGDGTRQLLTGSHLDTRNLVFAADGRAIAYTAQHGDSDMMPLGDLGCTVHYVRTAPAAQYVDAVLRFPGRCYFGIGLAIAGDTLFVAPP